MNFMFKMFNLRHERYVLKNFNYIIKMKYISRSKRNFHFTNWNFVWLCKNLNSKSNAKSNTS